MTDKYKIINPDGLPEAFILREIWDVENERNREVESAEFYRISEDEVREVFHWVPIKFNRIRRITGYLVGDMSHWNNGKRAEERDRVKHSEV